METTGVILMSAPASSEAVARLVNVGHVRNGNFTFFYLLSLYKE